MAARRIVVLYFAAVRERAGLGREELELPDAVGDVAELKSFLETRHPALKGVLGQVCFAVGDEIVDSARRIRAGDTVALLPPFSGG